jgi:glycosyltransferase involved in cell wall biosynthesis
MTISVLIPVNDYDIVALVRSLRSGMEKVPEYCEIIIGDDGSSAEYRKKFRSLEDDRTRVIISAKNIGRSAIRNKLALEAKGDFLLFIDADVMLPGTAEAYLTNWLPLLKSGRVICGGILYSHSKPGDPDKLLRWKYGRAKEQWKAAERNKKPNKYFSTYNVIIERSVFSKLRFNEEIRQYGFEDILFGYQLLKAGIEVIHTDNELVHEGLETNAEFINKTKLGIENLSRLYDKITDKKTFSSVVRILKTYNLLSFFRLTLVLAGFFIRYRERMERRLESSDVNLKLFAFYRMCMFCTFREIHRRRNTMPVF